MSPSKPPRIAGALALFALAACGNANNNAARVDGNHDSGPTIDQQSVADNGPASDAARSADQALDPRSDGSVFDMRTTDAGVPAQVFAVYFRKTPTDGTMGRIQAQGASERTLINGARWTSLALTGPVRSAASMRHDRPRPLPRLETSAIELPRGGGRLYALGSASSAGIRQVTPDGEHRWIYHAPGNRIPTDVAVSPNGQYVAAVAATSTGAAFFLARTDGKTFSNGASFLTIAANAGYRSPVFVGDALYFYVVPANWRYASELWRVELSDPTRPPARVALPALTIAGQAAKIEQLNIGVVVSEDQKNLGVVARTHLGSQLMLIDAQGQASAIGEPGPIVARGDSLSDAHGAQLAISPTGKRIAYIHERVGPQSVLHVATAGGTDVEVTGPGFTTQGSYDVGSLIFIDDDRLLFIASRSSSHHQTELFLFDAARQTTTNVSGLGDKTMPFDLDSPKHLSYGWLSADGKHFFFPVNDDPSDTNAAVDLWMFDVASAKVSPLSNGLRIKAPDTGTHYAYCLRADRRLMVARSANGSDAIYVLDESAPTELKPLGAPLSSAIRRIYLSPNCGSLAVLTHASTSDQLWLGQPTFGSSQHSVNLRLVYAATEMATDMVFRPDDSALLTSGGSSTQDRRLVFVDLKHNVGHTRTVGQRAFYWGLALGN
ncbi:MAG: hypothetical protein H6707_21105 [Deltaproteobacteria bacterium]|nr:hypothetical protein [Deltaproteobacteria bacterium]